MNILIKKNKYKYYMKKYYLVNTQEGGENNYSSSSSSEDSYNILPNVNKITVPREQLENSLAMLNCYNQYANLEMKTYLLKKCDEYQNVCNIINNIKKN